MGLNKWLAATLGAVLAVGAAGVQGYRIGRDSVIASQASAEAIRMETLHLAQMAAAEEIARIEVRHVTIRQQAETTLREIPVYRDCVNDAGVSSLLDAARENRDLAPGDRGLP